MLMKNRKKPLFVCRYFEAVLAFQNVKSKLKSAEQSSVW